MNNTIRTTTYPTQNMRFTSEGLLDFYEDPDIERNPQKGNFREVEEKGVDWEFTDYYQEIFTGEEEGWIRYAPPSNASAIFDLQNRVSELERKISLIIGTVK